MLAKLLTHSLFGIDARAVDVEVRSREAKEAARQAELDRAAQEKENQAKWERQLRERERQVRESEERQRGQRVVTGESRPVADGAGHRADAPPPPPQQSGL